MTDLEHADISRRLALAIGWVEADMIGGRPKIRIMDDEGFVQYFDYRDPEIAWRVAERFTCFPKKVGSEWHCMFYETHKGRDLYCSMYADTAALAVAMAVIKAKGQP